MSTNYYFQINSSLTINNDLSIELQDYLLSQIDNELHIGKRSAGWPPSFQKTSFYSSVKEMNAFYKENVNYLTIIDEYEDRTLSWRDLESELINWNKNESNLMSRDGFEDTYKDDEGYDFITVNFC